MKKIMYVVDFLPDVCNSVGDILNCLIKKTSSYENVIVKSDGYAYGNLNIKKINGYRCYFADIFTITEIIKNKSLTLFQKFMLILKKCLLNFAKLINKEDEFNRRVNSKHLYKIIKKEQPDLIVFFVFTPKVEYTDICIKTGQSYVFMLYDTFIERPGIDRNVYFPKEKYVIDNSKAYFVPGFFADEYYKIYGSEKINSFNLPLLIEKKDVENAYKNKIDFEFTYFGQVQSFRNGEKIRKMFAELNKKLDIFTSSRDCQGDDVFIIHDAITRDELFSTVAGSKFLVAFDNSVPYNMYLPSKVYLYVSFTKPVIIFGDNEESAIKNFMRDYPQSYYQNINESFDGLIEFINRNQSSSFDEKVYLKYAKYLPENALKGYSETIDALLTV